MTREEAILDYQEKAAKFAEENGSIMAMPDDEGMFDIGNGYELDAEEHHQVILGAL